MRGHRSWLLGQGDDIVPIPGTKRQKYLEENAAACALTEQTRRTPLASYMLTVLQPITEAGISVVLLLAIRVASVIQTAAYEMVL